MREDSRILIILGRPFLETARAMIDIFNKKITPRVGDEVVIFDVDQSIKRPLAEEDECYRIEDLDTNIHLKTQELLKDNQIDSFLLKNLEKCINQSNLESCGKVVDDSEFEKPIQRFFQIPIAPEDQEKTTFTCPYGTFAYRRMPFGLCNAPATFHRCMTAIFHDMVEDFIEVFMDDFLVFGIVLGHKISGKRIEVDKAKIDVIAKLPYPTNVKVVRSFLGYAGFYRRFIKEFSMISKPKT
ncbi:reverse transcriptase domain-containing protein [Tanacetum coccineum]